MHERMKKVRYKLMTSACTCLFAMTRAIGILTKQPQLRKKWISAIVEYIRYNYVDNNDGTLVAVDAIVGPDSRGYLFAFAVALKLHLPYIRIQVKEASQVQGDPKDLIEATYRNRENKVNFLYDIHHSIQSVVLSR